MKKAGRLTYATLEAMKGDPDYLGVPVAYWEAVSGGALRLLILGKVHLKSVDPAKPVYRLPDDTEGLVEAVSRDPSGGTEIEAVKTGFNGDLSVVTMSKKLVDVVQAIESREGRPVRVVLAKRKSGAMYLVHKEPLWLTREATLKALNDLLGVANRKKRKKILRRVPLDVGGLQTSRFGGTEGAALLVQAVPASPGLVVAQPGEVFAAETTTPKDAAKMVKAKAIVTGGGTLSHAAILAGSEGIPCIVGASEEDIKKITSASVPLSVDAHAGKVWAGALQVEQDDDGVEAALGEVLHHAKKFAGLKVLCNADTVQAILSGLGRGAQGVGLMRTEHMYEEKADELAGYIEAALKGDAKLRRARLSALLQATIPKFKDALTAVGGGGLLTVRLLDAPLNEFVKGKYQEENPAMGLRGCRFGILYSDFYAMQVQAVAEAVRQVDGGCNAEVGIMVPLVSEVGEVLVLKDLVERVWKAAGCASLAALRFGVMLETPRSCLIAGEIAPLCDFMSFGTNDLTQLTYGLSRDDASYLPGYAALGVLGADPFRSLDGRGVGRLMWLATRAAKDANPDVQVGICGQHGGDPDSIKTAMEVGVDYVSCVAEKVPGAILASLK